MTLLPLELLGRPPQLPVANRAIDQLDATAVTDVLEHLLDVQATDEVHLAARFAEVQELAVVLAALHADGLVERGAAAPAPDRGMQDRGMQDGGAQDGETRDGGARADGADWVALTDRGIEVATDRVRKHRLAERLLTDVLGVPWRTVHHEARRWEVLVSDEVEARLVDILDDPGTCPHGNPVPGSANAPLQVHARPLADVGHGLVRVVRVTEEVEADDAALALLDAAGFVPGAEGEVLARGPSGVEVAGAAADALVPPHVAARTWVEVLG